MPKHPTTFPSDTLVSSAALAQVAGIDLDTVNNWLKRGIISRSPIGGRQMKNRLFQMETVYKTAFIADLVKLGIPPSTAVYAVKELWRQWRGKEPVEERMLYAIWCQATPSGRCLWRGRNLREDHSKNSRPQARLSCQGRRLWCFQFPMSWTE
jgi:hypothetical protein